MPAEKIKGKPGPKGRDMTAKVQFRCTPAFRDWLNRYSASRDESVGTVIADAITRTAKLAGTGLHKPPQR